ncbi:MAG TPA: MFS transporter [Actinomycetota bacterium]|nr:MFS transporter [Actinomycetota bacterium]
MTATARLSGQRRGVAALGVLCAAQFMLVVDVVVVNVAIPSIRADLGLPDSRLQLIAVAYTLTFGSLLIWFGRMGDVFGRRRLFLAGLAVFTLASLATGLAHSGWSLVAARACQGVGAAMASPSALALLMVTFEEDGARGRALGYWGAVGSGGAIVGQLLGGALTDVLGWRSIFLINVPIGIATIALATRHLQESRPAEATRVHSRGAILLTAGLAAATLTLTRIGEGASATTTAVGAGVACALLAAFAVSERRHDEPLVDHALLRTRQVVTGNVLLAVNAGTLGAALFFTTLYLQVGLGYSPLAVGAAFAPITLLVLLISPRIGARIASVGARQLLSIGFGFAAVGTALLSRLPDDGSYLRDVLPALALIAIGSAFSYAPTFVVGTTGVTADWQGAASGLLNASQELGAAIGITVLAAIATAASVTAVDGHRTALIVAAGVLAAAQLLIRQLPDAPD